MTNLYRARLTRVCLAGQWLVAKARRQQQESGTYAAAHNLRKQGCPIDLALTILARGIK